jgi:RNA polymerase sigma-70 factor, ECF subfamily
MRTDNASLRPASDDRATPDGALPDRAAGERATTADLYADLRPLMFSIAYRMLGRVTEAEDIVQEAFLRYHRTMANSAEPDSPKAYLAAVTTRLCIDQLRSARQQREAYVGEWLPEPLLTGEPIGGAQAVAADPAALAEQADSLSMAFLLLLERLTPVERAVFLLHDVFSYDYDETARIVGKSKDYCRQLARRARQHVTEHRPRFEVSAADREELAARFFAAVADGDLAGLLGLLAEDVTVYGDSGGIRPSWPGPITGSKRVSQVFIGLVRQLRLLSGVVRPVSVNGQPGAVFLAGDGSLICVVALDIQAGLVTAIRSTIARDKLRHLGPLADLEELYEQSRAAPAPGRADRST